jgi:FkbM family methyltransferase
MKNYSQYDEQEQILKVVADIPASEGSFIDVGAFDGENYSNTMALVELGWQGVMVEPALSACTRLLARHGGSDRVTIVHAVVGLNHGLVKFWNEPETYSSTIRAPSGQTTATVLFDPHGDV